ncbi:hypothetical protein [Salinarimonas ramus]|uniref:Heme exporter protein D n=1 Tax=Salinarimonas ramus TaxID=690164 RepID=A0A917V3W3_9HYPH|nr:hypothetical protein [Salinarimonas ramus]GGK35975.1 hypothetical protein GCM10011322_23720 [Salinarimonas ramus]
MNAAEIFTLGKAGLWLLLPIAFGIWQLVSVRREIRRDREKAAATNARASEATREPTS